MNFKNFYKCNHIETDRFWIREGDEVESSSYGLLFFIREDDKVSNVVLDIDSVIELRNELNEFLEGL